jgi:hypothetical protein
MLARLVRGIIIGFSIDQWSKHSHASEAPVFWGWWEAVTLPAIERHAQRALLALAGDFFKGLLEFGGGGPVCGVNALLDIAVEGGKGPCTDFGRVCVVNGVVVQVVEVVFVVVCIIQGVFPVAGLQDATAAGEALSLGDTGFGATCGEVVFREFLFQVAEAFGKVSVAGR